MLSPPWATLARANAGRAVPLRSARRKSRGTRFATSIARQSFRCRRRNLTQPLPTRATVVVTSLAARQDAPDDASSPRTAFAAPATDVQPPESGRSRASPKRAQPHSTRGVAPVMVRSRLSILVVAVLIATLLSFPAPGSTRSWRNVINDQFTAGTRVPAHWGLYSVRYGSGQRNCASPRQVFVNSHGYLVLRESYRRTGKCGAGWYTGGMKIAAAYKGVDQRIT